MRRLSICVVAETETAESQYAQAEEHSNKLKQMLVKTKKDLADAKKLVHLSAISGCHVLLFNLYLCTWCTECRVVCYASKVD